MNKVFLFIYYTDYILPLFGVYAAISEAISSLLPLANTAAVEE